MGAVLVRGVGKVSFFLDLIVFEHVHSSIANSSEDCRREMCANSSLVE